MQMPSPMLLAISFLLLAVLSVIAMFLSLTHGSGTLTMISKLFPSTRPEIFREEREENAAGFVPHRALDKFVQQIGMLEADAHPSGKARFGSESVMVELESGGFLERGSAVRAVSIRGGALLVRPEPRPGEGQSIGEAPALPAC